MGSDYWIGAAINVVGILLGGAVAVGLLVWFAYGPVWTLIITGLAVFVTPVALNLAFWSLVGDEA